MDYDETLYVTSSYHLTTEEIPAPASYAPTLLIAQQHSPSHFPMLSHGQPTQRIDASTIRFKSPPFHRDSRYQDPNDSYDIQQSSAPYHDTAQDTNFHDATHFAQYKNTGEFDDVEQSAVILSSGHVRPGVDQFNSAPSLLDDQASSSSHSMNELHKSRFPITHPHALLNFNNNSDFSFFNPSPAQPCPDMCNSEQPELPYHRVHQQQRIADKYNSPYSPDGQGNNNDDTYSRQLYTVKTHYTSKGEHSGSSSSSDTPPPSLASSIPMSNGHLGRSFPLQPPPGDFGHFSSPRATLQNEHSPRSPIPDYEPVNSIGSSKFSQSSNLTANRVSPSMELSLSEGKSQPAPKKKKSKMHKCEICFKKFPRPSGLRTHMNTHDNTRPYACSYPGCGRTFGVRSNAKRHLRTHGITPLPAPTSNNAVTPYVVGFEPPVILPASNAHESTPMKRAPFFRLRWLPLSLTSRTNAASLRSMSDQEMLSEEENEETDDVDDNAACHSWTTEPSDTNKNRSASSSLSISPPSMAHSSTWYDPSSRSSACINSPSSCYADEITFEEGKNDNNSGSYLDLGRQPYFQVGSHL